MAVNRNPKGEDGMATGKTDNLRNMVLIPVYFFMGTVRWRVQRYFSGDDVKMKEYFQEVFRDICSGNEGAGILRQKEADERPIDVMIKDLLVLWNFAADTTRAQRKPRAFLGFTGPEDKQWAIREAVRTVINVSDKEFGQAPLVAITGLVPRASRFFRKTLGGLGACGERYLPYLTPFDPTKYYLDNLALPGTGNEIPEITCPFGEIQFSDEFYLETIAPQLPWYSGNNSAAQGESKKPSFPKRDNIEEGMASMIW